MVRYWLLETGAGLGVVFISIVVTIAGTVIAMQALRAALVPSLREYAMLRAFGVGTQALRWLVIEQTLWLAAAALSVAAVVVIGTAGLAKAVDVPAAITWQGMMACGALVVAIVLAAAVGAARLVSRADPFVLLR